MSLTPGLQQLDLCPRHWAGVLGRAAGHFGSSMNLKAPLWVVTSRRRARSLMARSRTGSSVASSLAVSVLRGLADPPLCGKTNLNRTERSPATPDSTRDNVRIFSEFSTGKLRDHHLPYLDRRDERTHKLFGQKERKLYLYIIQPDF